MRTIKNIIATDFDRVVRPAYAIIEVGRKGQITVWNEFNDLDIARQVMENIRKGGFFFDQLAPKMHSLPS